MSDLREDGIQELNDGTNRQVQRELAELIISGEYKACVVLILHDDEKMTRTVWCDGESAGGTLTCYGLAEYGKEFIGDTSHGRIELEADE